MSVLPQTVPELLRPRRIRPGTACWGDRGQIPKESCPRPSVFSDQSTGHLVVLPFLYSSACFKQCGFFLPFRLRLAPEKNLPSQRDYHLLYRTGQVPPDACGCCPWPPLCSVFCSLCASSRSSLLFRFSQPRRVRQEAEMLNFFVPNREEGNRSLRNFTQSLGF